MWAEVSARSSFLADHGADVAVPQGAPGWRWVIWFPQLVLFQETRYLMQMQISQKSNTLLRGKELTSETLQGGRIGAEKSSSRRIS